MLHHHGIESYELAAEKAVSWATQKLEALISKGRAQTAEVLDKVDKTIIRDRVTRSTGIGFYPSKTPGELIMEAGRKDEPLHEHALNQVVERLDGNQKVKDWAFQPETAEEFASILNAKMKRQGSKKYLVRSVDGQVRGFMSDRYRRLDVRPLVESLVSKAVKKYDAVPIEAHALETSFHMKMILPKILLPTPFDIGVFGLTFRNSDFGAGRLYVKGFFNRLWCTNLAMCEDGISQVHLGRALSDDIAFSQKTYELDTMTMASAVGDVVDFIFSNENIVQRMEAIKSAAKREPDLDIGQVLKKTKLHKGESKQVEEAFNSPDIELLPPGQNRWRLSNAISLIAQKTEPDRRLELETVAGEVAGLVRRAA